MDQDKTLTSSSFGQVVTAPSSSVLGSIVLQRVQLSEGDLTADVYSLQSTTVEVRPTTPQRIREISIKEYIADIRSDSVKLDVGLDFATDSGEKLHLRLETWLIILWRRTLEPDLLLSSGAQTAPVSVEMAPP
jgi:hypothetical protein